jgi:hypothetical protein
LFHEEFVMMLITTSIISYFILFSSSSLYGQPAFSSLDLLRN